MSEVKGLYGGRYRIGEKVGQGGVGAVYRAIQEPLGRHVALKILRPEYSRNPLVRRRFTREARAVAALNHPNIATIFDFGVEADGTLFIAMEFIEGVSLSRVMRGGVRPRYLLATLDPILAALAHAHAKGVIHRDLKPDNILIAEVPGGGRLPSVSELETTPQLVKLVDFGIATVIGSENDDEPEDTRAGEVVGTPLYMSPEQARGDRALTPAVDLYTVGVVLFEGLSGHHPFAGYEPDETPMDIMIRHVAMSPPELHPPANIYVPEALRSIVRRCLQKKPADRYMSAAQLREALREARSLLDAHAQLQAEADGGEVKGRAPDAALLDTAPELSMVATPTVAPLPPLPPETPAEPEPMEPLRPPARTRVSQAAPTIKLVEVHPAEVLRTDDDDSLDEEGRPPVELFGDAIHRGAEVAIPDWPRFRSDIRSALRGVRFDVPLVGREEERRVLVEAVARCIHDGLGQVILLEGGAGIGKTKLATWLGEYVAERGKMRFVTGSFLREDGNGLRGLRDALEGLFGVRHLGRPAVRAAIVAQLRAWDLDDPRDAEALTSFLRPTDTTPLGGTPQEALFALLVRVLERAGRERALLILLDDIHWSGPVLGDFLEFLAVEFRYRPCNLIVLTTVRSEDLPSNPRMTESLRRLSRYSGETVQRLAVRQMGAEECERLIETIMPADDGLKASITQRSQGNPLHVVQLLQYLYQEELLGWDEERKLFRVTGAMDAINRVPPDLADLLLLRFEQIEERHQGNGRLLALLERCAVLGDRFAFEVVDDVLCREHNHQLSQVLEHGIDILLQESILTSVRGRGEDMLAFTHGLIREVLIENMTGLLQSRRLHRLAAAAKEAYYKDRLEVVSREIASHYLTAGDRRRALDFVLIAAGAAQASYHLMDAIRLYAQAEELARDLAGVEALQRLKLGRRIADLREGFGQLHAAGQAYASLLRGALFKEQPTEAESLLNPPEEAKALTRPELNLLHESLHHSPRLAQLGDLEREEITRATLGVGRVLRHTGDLEMAEKFLERALEMAREAEQLAWVGAAQLQLGRLAWTRGDYDAASDRASRTLKDAMVESNPYNRAEALHLLAEVARLRGDPARTAELLTRAREAYEILGDRRHVALCLRDLAQLARARKDLENAARLFAEARQRFEELGDRHAVASCFNGLGEVARFNARPDVANSCYQRAFETFRSIGARLDAAISLTNLGICALTQSDLKAASDAFSEALRLARDTTAHPYLAMGLHLNIALLHALEERWEESRDHLTIGLEQSDKHHIADPDYARPLEALGQLHIGEGRQELGERLLERANQMWSDLGQRR